MSPNNAQYLVPRNRGMSLTWAGGGVGGLAFAAIPWAMLVGKRILPSWPTALVLIAWSSFPLALALYLFFLATCRIELSGSPGCVSRRVRWLLMDRLADYRIDSAYLVRQWHHTKGGGSVRDVLFVRTARRKHLLANELTCSDLPNLLHWIADVTHAKTFDARQRQPVGT